MLIPKLVQPHAQAGTYEAHIETDGHGHGLAPEERLVHRDAARLPPHARLQRSSRRAGGARTIAVSSGSTHFCPLRQSYLPRPRTVTPAHTSARPAPPRAHNTPD